MSQRTNLKLRRASEPAPSFVLMRHKASSTTPSSSGILPSSWGLRRHSNQTQRNRSFNSKKSSNQPTECKQLAPNFGKQTSIFYTEVLMIGDTFLHLHICIEIYTFTCSRNNKYRIV